MPVPTETDQQKPAAAALSLPEDTSAKKTDDLTLTVTPSVTVPQPTKKILDSDLTLIAASWINQKASTLGTSYQALKETAIKDTAVVQAKITEAISYASPEHLHAAFEKIKAYASHRAENHYGGACATIIRQDYFQPAGIMSTTDPHGDAFKYKGFIEAKGYPDIRASWSPDKAQPGDVVVFDKTARHKDGHIQVMLADGHWYSDCKQERFLPNQVGFAGYHVYHTGSPPPLPAITIAQNDKTAPTADASAPAHTGGHRRNYAALTHPRRGGSAEAVHRHRDFASADTTHAAPTRGRSPAHGMGHGGPALTG